MAKEIRIPFDPLVTETSQRLYGLNALVELVYRATPEVELQGRDALKQLAQQENWDYEDYRTEDQFLDVKFRYWLPNLAAYSIIVLLSSIVETQLVAYARRVGQREKSAFDLNDLRGSVLDKTAVYVKKVSGAELTKNPRWKTLRDLQDLRDIIVHRAGKPGDDKRQQLELICKSYPGISLEANPYSIRKDIELGITVHSCRYFLGEVEQFFKDLLRVADSPFRGGLWPNVQSGFPKP